MSMTRQQAEEYTQRTGLPTRRTVFECYCGATLAGYSDDMRVKEQRGADMFVCDSCHAATRARDAEEAGAAETRRGHDGYIRDKLSQTRRCGGCGGLYSGAWADHACEVPV